MEITLSVSESLTGGKIQDKLVSVSGASSYFQGGVTVYNIDQKVNLLGIDREHAGSVNCVSERVAQEMASGCNELFGSDIAIGITGYAETIIGGPYEAKYGRVEVPFCYYSINYKGEVLESGKLETNDTFRNRNSNRTQFSLQLSKKLVDKLIELKPIIKRDKRLDNLLK